MEFVPGTGRSPRTVQTQETKGDTSKSQAQGGEKCHTDQEGATPQHVDERGRQHPPHQQMERRTSPNSESRLCGGQSRETGERDRQAGLPCHDGIKFNQRRDAQTATTRTLTAQQVAPSNESRTQVAVNNEGKTNEATKNLKEPLQKGQTTLKDARQQQQQDKPQKKTGKGMKDRPMSATESKIKSKVSTKKKKT